MALTNKEYKDLSIKEFTDLLDAGCGPAPMITLLSEKYPDKHYTGLDLIPAMIEQAKKLWCDRISETLNERRKQRSTSRCCNLPVLLATI